MKTNTLKCTGKIFLTCTTLVLLILSSCKSGNTPTQTEHDGMPSDSSQTKMDTATTKAIPMKDNGNDTVHHQTNNGQK